MEHELPQAFLVIFFLVMAGILAYYFRHYLRPLRKDETIGAFITRTHEEKQLDKIAKLTMFGKWTVALNIADMVLLLAILWFARFETMILFVALAYLAIGSFLTKQVAYSARREDYHRLSLFDRIHYRMIFAWAWPYYLAKSRNAR